MSIPIFKPLNVITATFSQAMKNADLDIYNPLNIGSLQTGAVTGSIIRKDIGVLPLWPQPSPN